MSRREMPARNNELGVLINPFNRRTLFRGAGGLIVASSLVACSGDSNSPDPTGGSKGKPKRGGNFRLGLTGGGSKDIMDANNALTMTDLARYLIGWETLLTYSDTNEIVAEGLAESVELDNPTQYTIRLRQGVEFHNGKTMTVDDVIDTFQRIGTEANGLPGYPKTLPMDLANMKKLDTYTLRLPMKTPDSTVYESFAGFRICPVGYTGYEGDISTQIGTGAFRAESFTPGQESVHVRHPNYWRGDGSPWFDQVTISNFTDPTAQVNALLGGQIDAMTDVPTAQIAVLESQGVEILSSSNGFWSGLAMAVDIPPFDDPRVRQAFRLIPNRQEMLEQVASGRGNIGNDLYAINDPAYNDSLPQREQDIAQARALLEAAGQENLEVDLFTTNGAAGMVEISLVFAKQAKEAGVTVNVKNLPGSTFWSDYTKYPFAAGFWTPRSYLEYVSVNGVEGGAYNETHWPPKSGEGSEFATLYEQALVAPVNSPEQAEIIGKMQEIEYELGGYIIPFFSDLNDAHVANVQGLEPTKLQYNLSDFGHGFRTMWFG